MEAIPQLQDNSIDFVLTSPPYFNSGKKYQRKKGIHYDRDVGEVLYVIIDCFELLYPKLKENSFIALNLGFSLGESGVLRPFRIVERICQKLGYFCVDRWVWHKLNPVPIQQRPTNSIEDVFILSKHPHTNIPDSENFPYTHNFFECAVVNKIAGLEDEKEIPPSFPEAFATKFIEVYSKIGDVVLDPFAGTGTTGISAMLSGRNTIGFELSPKFYLQSIKRLKYHNLDSGINFTNKNIKTSGLRNKNL